MVRKFTANIANYLKSKLESTASNIKMNGTQSAGTSENMARADHVHPTDTSRAASSHTHGNVTNAGAIGSAANKPVITTTSGKLTTGDFEGTASNIKMNGTQAAGSLNTFARGDHVHPTDTSRASTAVATSSANGLMSSTDKDKLDKSLVVGQANAGGTTSAFTASITGVTLTHGTIIALYNAVGANAASATLNVNSLGAKPIYYNSAAISAGRFPNKSVCLFMYNTSIVSTGVWQLIYSYDSNNTYTAASATPLMDGTAAIGTSAKYAREDHVHPVDTSRAASSHSHSKSEITDFPSSMTPTSHAHGNLQNDGKVGTSDNASKNVVTDSNGKITTEAKPTIPSANTTATNIKMDGTQSAGSASTFAKADHVHPTDTSRASTDVASQSANGLMSSSDKTKLDGVATGANAYSHPAYTARTGKPTANQTPGFGGTATISQITSDASGHVTGATDRTITIPSSVVTQSANGLAISADKEKLDKSMTVGFANVGGTTSAFTASITGVTLTHGTIIALYNAIGNNAASATLNVNSLGAKPIYYKASTITASTFPNKCVCLFMYNTSIVSTGCWQLIYSYDSNSTYTASTLKDPNAHSNAINTAANAYQTAINSALDEAIYNTNDRIDDIVSGDLDLSNYVKTDDSRLTDQRTPKDNSVTSAKIADGTIVNGDIANTTITGGKLVSGTITATQLASNAVETAKIKDSNVTTAKIADSAVTSAKIADGTIVNDDIANTTITGGKLVSGTITATQLASNAVETAKIKDSAVTTAKIADGTILNADINASAAIATSKIADSTKYDNIGSNANATQAVINAAIDSKLGALAKIDVFEVKDSLPSASANTMDTLYIIKSSSNKDDNYDTYITVKNGSTYTWEKIDSTSLDLSNYVRTDDSKYLSIPEIANNSPSPNSRAGKKGSSTKYACEDHAHPIVTEVLKPTEESPIDLNDKTEGVYTCSAAYNKQYLLNAPVSNVPLYIESKDYGSNSTIQIAYTIVNDTDSTININRMFWRIRYSNNWDMPWKEVADISQIPTKVSDLTNDADYISKTSNDNGFLKSNGSVATFGTGAANVATGNHTHGTITNDGKVGTTANKPLITGTNGVVQAGSFGTAANTFCQGNDSRLSNARTPTAHNQASSTITDTNTYSNIGNTAQTQDAINSAIDNKLGALSNIELVEVVGSLPTASASTMNKLYLKAESTGATNDNYEIFITVKSGSNYGWEKVDTARIDLSNYVTNSDSRLTDSRTPKSHAHGSLANGGTLNSDISSVNKIAVTDSSNNLKTISKLPADKVTHQDISGKLDTAGTGLSKSGTTLNHSNSVTAQTTSALKKIKYDAQGHITGTDAVAKSDITGLGIPAQDTTYSVATSSANGLMSKDDKGELDSLVNRYDGNYIGGVATVNKPYLRLFHLQSKNGNSSSGHLIFEIIGNNNDRQYAKIRVDLRQNTNETEGSFTVTPLEVYGINLNVLYFGFRDDYPNTCLDVFRKVGSYTNFYVRIYDDHLRDGSYTMFSPVVNGTESYTSLEEAANTLYNNVYSSTLVGDNYSVVNNFLPKTNLQANSFVKTGGTASQLLLANGGVKATSDFANSGHSHGDITNDGKIGTTANKPVITGTGGILTAGSFEDTATNIKMNGAQSVGSMNTFARGDHVHPTDTSRAPTSHAHGNLQNDGKVGTSDNASKNVVTDSNGKITTEAKPTIPSANTTATNIKMDGTQSAGSASTFAKADHVHPTDTSRAASSHTHGSITNAGAIGSTAGLPIITGTSGKLQAGAFGSSAPGADTASGSAGGSSTTTFAKSDHTHPKSNLYAEANHGHEYDADDILYSDDSSYQTVADALSDKFDSRNFGTGADDVARGNHTHSDAVAGGASGFMTGSDKTKLNGIATGATKNTVSNSLTDTSTTNALSAAQGKALNDNKWTKTPTSLYSDNGVVDFNSLTTVGSYLIYSGNIDGTSHCPDSQGGLLIVHSTIKGVAQILINYYSTSPNIYYRISYNNTWRDWKRLYASKEPSITTYTSLQNNWSGTIKIAIKNGWALVTGIDVKCSTTSSGYVTLLSSNILVNQLNEKIYATGTPSSDYDSNIFRINSDGVLEGRCLVANQNSEFTIMVPVSND